MTIGTADRFRLAEGYLETGDPLQALDILARLDEQAAAHHEVRVLRARALFHSAQLERAQRELEQLVDVDPGDAYLRFLLGRTLERRSRPHEALPHLRLAAAMSGRAEYRERLADLTERTSAAPVLPDQPA